MITSSLTKKITRHKSTAKYNEGNQNNTQGRGRPLNCKQDDIVRRKPETAERDITDIQDKKIDKPKEVGIESTNDSKTRVEYKKMG